MVAGDANYRGLVAARLARFKRFPADARRRGEQGSAIISFVIDGVGRVTSIRLMRATGFVALDDEVQAMVRRHVATGHEDARERTTLTREELETIGMTAALAEIWRDFYRDAKSLNPANRRRLRVHAERWKMAESRSPQRTIRLYVTRNSSALADTAMSGGKSASSAS